MSVDYTRGQDGEPVNTGDDASMFAPTPIWEKNNRRRRGSGRARPSAAATGPAADVTSAEATREAAMSPNGDAVVTRDRTVARRGGSIAPAAIAIGVIVLAALAAAGWYATRSNSGMAQMTPGAPATAPATAITPGSGTLAANTAPAAPPSAATPATPVEQVTHETTTTKTTPAATTTTRRRTTHSRTLAAAPERPVTSTAATGAGVNTGVTTSAASTGSVNPPSSTTAPPAPSSAAPPPIAPAPTVTPTLPSTPPPSSSPNPPADTTATTPQSSP